jgi:hypothetical protein
MDKYTEVGVIDIGLRNRDIGEMAMRSYIGPRSFCKAIVLSSFITRKQSTDRMNLDMRLYFELGEYIEEAISDNLRVDEHKLTESEVEKIRSQVYRDIHAAARWLRNKTHDYTDRVREVGEIRVAPDFARGVLVVRFEPS